MISEEARQVLSVGRRLVFAEEASADEIIAGQLGPARAMVGHAIRLTHQFWQCAGAARVGLGSKVEEQIELQHSVVTRALK